MEKIEFLNRACPSPRLDSQGTLYWYKGDTFIWRINFTFTTLDPELTLTDIQDDIITFSFFNSEEEQIIQRSFKVSESSAAAVYGGTIQGYYQFFITEDPETDLDINTNLFSIDTYRYTVTYRHGDYITTVAYKNFIKVE